VTILGDNIYAIKKNTWILIVAIKRLV
jgi:hypothetical protein